MNKPSERFPLHAGSDLEPFVKALVDDSHEIVSVIDAQLRFVAFSESYSREFEALWGVCPQRGQSLDELLNRLPETFGPVKRDWERALAGERYRVFEEFPTSNRSKRPREIEFRPIIGSQGKAIGAIQTAREVAEAQAQEEEQRTKEGEALHQTMIEHSRDVVFSLSLEGTLHYVSPAWERIMGTPCSDAVDVHIESYLHPDDLDACLAHISMIAKGEGSDQAIEHRARTTSGPWRVFSTRLALVRTAPGVPSHMVGTAIDLTERVLAEKAIRESEQRFRAFVDQASVGIAHADMTGRFLLVNERYCELVGRTREELSGLTLADVTHIDDMSRNLSLIEQLDRTGQPFEMEKRYVRPDGSVIWAKVRASLVLDEAGEPIFSQAIVIDVTEKVVAEAALRRQLATTRAISDNADSALLLLDERARIAEANPAFYRLTGLSHKKSVGFSAYSLLHLKRGVEHHKTKHLTMRRAFADGIPLHGHEDICRRPDGTTFPVSLSYTPILDEMGGVLGGVIEFRDVTKEKQAERELQKREERFRFLAEAIPLPLWAGDPLGPLTFVNARWRELYQVESAPSRERVLAIVHPEDLPSLIKTSNEGMAAEKPFSTRCRLLVPGQGYRWHLLSATPEISEGHPMEWIGTYVDLHDEIEREQGLELTARVGQALAEDLNLERILQALTDSAVEATEAEYGGFFQTAQDEEKSPLYATPEAEVALGRFVDILQSDGKADSYPWVDVVRSGDVTKDDRFAAGFSLQEGPEKPLPVRSYMEIPVASRLTQNVGLLVLGHPDPDLFTEKHERLLVAFAAQAAIALDNARLYKDQARLNDELVLARDDALSSSKAKSQFLANMSHEIRTPLNGIIGMASLLNTLDIGEEAQSMVGTISSSGRTLLRVLDEVLDLARIEAGRMEIELVPTNVDRVVTEVASLYRSEALKNGVEITFDAPKTSMPLVLLDSLRFRQVVSNLVSNAVKFTHGGTVGLSWTWIHVGESLRLSFRVRDTGIGIPSDRLTKVFESFTQADGSIQRKYGGSGLGLAITQHLVELMGGLISVQSEVGIGTVFEITLTLEPTIETPRKPDPLQEPQPAGLYVLLAEDNSVNVLVVKAILGKLGCTVDVAEDGLRAIEMAEKDRYDLLLMDVQMPFCDGLEATRILRKAEALHHKSRLPIVALTANAMASDREACAKAGMDDFISKPITLDAMGDLLARVKSRNMTIAMQI